MDAAKENTGDKNYFTYRREEPAGGDAVHQVRGEKVFFVNFSFILNTSTCKKQLVHCFTHVNPLICNSSP